MNQLEHKYSWNMRFHWRQFPNCPFLLNAQTLITSLEIDTTTRFPLCLTLKNNNQIQVRGYVIDVVHIMNINVEVIRIP